MKLYKAKIAPIAHETISRLCGEGDIESERRTDAEADLVAIMEDFLRRDVQLRDDVRDIAARRQLPYDQHGKLRQQLAEQREHPLGDDVERYLARQFTEALMITPFVDEVFSDDKTIYKKILAVLKSNDVDEAGIRDEARGRIKNLREGTIEYEIALEAAIKDVKKKRGL